MTKHFWKGFKGLVSMGYSPLKLVCMSIRHGYWRAVISSQNGDLYFDKDISWKEILS